jgi:hypothetical protein
MTAKTVRFVERAGRFYRLYRGGFGADFPVGPYETREAAFAAPDDFWQAMAAPMLASSPQAEILEEKPE